jgi:DNA-binding transcriptional regulator/RsmH inhibitor MraZ
MPQSLRQHYKDAAVVVKQKGRLKVMAPTLFESLADSLANRFVLEGETGLHNFLDSGKQSILAYVFANAYELGFDSQGRLTIPKVVRQQLGLAEDMPVRWRGLGQYAELLVGGVERDEKADCARVEEEGAIDRLIGTLLSSTTPSALDEVPGEGGENGDN